MERIYVISFLITQYLNPYLLNYLCPHYLYIHYFVQNRVKDIAFSLYYGFDPRKLPPDNKNLINTLKSLSQDTSIVIMKPDKGNGIVILDMLRKLK